MMLQRYDTTLFYFTFVFFPPLPLFCPKAQLLENRLLLSSGNTPCESSKTFFMIWLADFSILQIYTKLTALTPISTARG